MSGVPRWRCDLPFSPAPPPVPALVSPPFPPQLEFPSVRRTSRPQAVVPAPLETVAPLSPLSPLSPISPISPISNAWFECHTFPMLNVACTPGTRPGVSPQALDLTRDCSLCCLFRSFHSSRFPPLSPQVCHRAPQVHHVLGLHAGGGKGRKYIPHATKVQPSHKCLIPPLATASIRSPSKQLPSLGSRLPCSGPPPVRGPKRARLCTRSAPPRPPLRALAPIVSSGYALPHSLRYATPPSLAGDHGAGAAPEPPHGV